MNMTLFGPRVFADIKGLRTKSSLTIQLGPQATAKCCSKRNMEERRRDKRRYPAEDGAESGVVQPQAEDCLEIRKKSAL